MTVRAVFLDRDGVLIASDVVDGVPTPREDAELLEGVEDACALLRDAGFRLVMITNQPDIARGLVPRSDVERVNETLRATLRLDDVRLCPHDDADGCECRKPKPGMLRAAARDADIDLTCSFTVGDRWRDIEAGRSAATTTILIDHQYQERSADNPDMVVGSLLEAVPFILGRDMDAEAYER